MRKLIIIICSLPLAIYSCTSGEAGITKTISSNPETKQQMELAEVVSDQPAFTISLPGELLPYEEVEIYPKVKGFVKKLYADRGTLVKKGQLLALLEAPEMGNTYAAKRASTQTAYQKFLFSKQSYDRLKTASEKAGSVAAIELDRAYSQLLADSAAYQSSSAETAAGGQLNDYLEIKAPFSGIITGRYFSEGALAGENINKPLFQLAQTNKLRLTIAVPEKEKGALNEEAVVEFELIDMPGEKFTATFSRSSETIDAHLRSVIAEFDVENKDKKLTAGQYAKARLTLKRKMPSLWVPQSSIVDAQSGTFVVKSEDGVAKRIPVVTGIRRDGLTEVFGNMQAGEKVLLRGSEEVKPGEKVIAGK